jgi:hypothetical protein
MVTGVSVRLVPPQRGGGKFIHEGWVSCQCDQCRSPASRVGRARAADGCCCFSPAGVDVGDIKVLSGSRRSLKAHMTPLGSASGEPDGAGCCCQRKLKTRDPSLRFWKPDVERACSLSPVFSLVTGCSGHAQLLARVLARTAAQSTYVVSSHCSSRRTSLGGHLCRFGGLLAHHVLYHRGRHQILHVPRVEIPPS